MVIHCAISCASWVTNSFGHVAALHATRKWVVPDTLVKYNKRPHVHALGEMRQTCVSNHVSSAVSEGASLQLSVQSPPQHGDVKDS